MSRRWLFSHEFLQIPFSLFQPISQPLNFIRNRSCLCRYQNNYQFLSFLGSRSPNPPLLSSFTQTNHKRGFLSKSGPSLSSTSSSTKESSSSNQQQQQQQQSHCSIDEQLFTHLDYRSFISRKEEMAENIKKRKSQGNVNEVVELHSRLGKEEQTLNELLHRKKALAKTMKSQTTTKISEEERGKKIQEGADLKAEIKRKQELLVRLKSQMGVTGLRLPNWTHPSVPVGDYDCSARVISHFGIQPSPSENQKSYLEIGKELDLFDFEAGAKVSGSRFCYFKNDAVFLEFALVQWAMSELVQRGFTPVITPEIVRDNYLQGAGFQPRLRSVDPQSQNSEDLIVEDNQIYHIEGSGVSLIGTSEIPLIGQYADQIIPNEKLPIKLVGFSHCFREETGGKGISLYRLHQFSKVCITEGNTETSEKCLEEVLQIQNDLLMKLGLSGRVLELPTEDMGAPAYHKYDSELWMPSFNKYGEVTSASNCTDYQSRRLNIRQKEKSAERKHPFVHIVNATALAVPRIILSILEQCQDSNGRIQIPKCLVPFFRKETLP